MTNRRELLKAVAGTAMLSAVAAAAAPDKINRVVVGFAPGTATDALGRVLAEK
jgi:tripartite-type tricarboxylate transporter receptor subunit TctC